VVIRLQRKAPYSCAVTLPTGSDGQRRGPCRRGRDPGVIERLGQFFDHFGLHSRRNTATKTRQLGNNRPDAARARFFFPLRYWGGFVPPNPASSSISEGGRSVFTSGIAGQRPHAGWALGASICLRWGTELRAPGGRTRTRSRQTTPCSPGVVRDATWANMAEAIAGASNNYPQTQNGCHRRTLGRKRDAEASSTLCAELLPGQVLVVDGGAVLFESRSSQKRCTHSTSQGGAHHEILKTGALVKHRFSGPVTMPRPSSQSRSRLLAAF